MIKSKALKEEINADRLKTSPTQIKCKMPAITIFTYNFYHHFNDYRGVKLTSIVPIERTDFFNLICTNIIDQFKSSAINGMIKVMLLFSNNYIIRIL